MLSAYPTGRVVSTTTRSQSSPSALDTSSLTRSISRLRIDGSVTSSSPSRTSSHGHRFIQDNNALGVTVPRSDKLETLWAMNRSSDDSSLLP